MTILSEADDVVIRVGALSKRYGRKGIQAVKGVSFEISKGQVFGLIGPDGAGKTSILQILAGVLDAEDGSAMVGGVDVLKQPEKVKSFIGYMPQGIGLNLYDSLTVKENIAFFRDLRKLPEAQFRENRDRLVAMTRLSPFLDRQAGKLSGGMRQKLALICTLIHLPDILLLDEPTTGVDPISRRDFWTIIHDLVTSRNVTVLLTTSYMDEAERCHQVALMHEGEIIAEGAPEQLSRGLPGKLMALTGPAPVRIMQALSTWSKAESVALFGSEVHVLLEDPAADVLSHLRSQGIVEVKVREISAGLEDIFVHRVMEKRQAGSALEAGGIDKAEVIEAQIHTEKSISIQTQDLTCRFGDFVAVSAVSLEIYAGEIFGLLGPNGAGKTTLIKMLCGLQTPSEGSAIVAGFDVQHSREELRGHIGYMSQRFSLYRDLSVIANMNLYAGLYSLPRKRRDARIAVLLGGLGLTRYAQRLTLSLPLGLRQRLALACALIHEPLMLFLDEPTSGVDPIARRQFWDRVHLLAQQGGITVVVSTHYMDEAEHCDRLGLMQQGKLIAVGSPFELKAQAQARAGPMVVVQASDFARAFDIISPNFPHAMLYGRSTQWQSTNPGKDMAKVRKLLSDAHIPAEVSEQGLSMEETFVNFMETTGGDDV